MRRRLRGLQRAFEFHFRGLGAVAQAALELGQRRFGEGDPLLRAVEADAAAHAFSAQAEGLQAGFEQRKVTVVRTAEVAQAFGLLDRVHTAHRFRILRVGGGTFRAHAVGSWARTRSPVTEFRLAEVIFTSTNVFRSASVPSKWSAWR